MMHEEALMEVVFRHSKKKATVSLDRLRARIVEFLEHYCERPLVDEAFLDHVSGTTGDEKFRSLLESAGYGDRPASFLRTLVSQLEQAGSADPRRVIKLGDVVLPYQLLLAVLEVLIPGEGYKTVKTVSQLEELTNITVPTEQRADLQEVIDTYPVRLSLHTVRQMRLSRYIAHQYHPFVGELDPAGEVHTWIGQFWRGIIEQMYQNRVIFIMNMACPVYCRFCFRKHKECRNQRTPNKIHVKQAVLYVENEPAIKEIVLTGGDPFMNRSTLQHAVRELAKVPHIKTLRLASRAVSYYPQMFLRDDGYWLNYLIRTNLELSQKNKRLELATHFLHPDEISPDALDVISHLVRSGVPVYVQTPFVNGCNESGRELVELFNVLRAVGAEIHYIFMPTSPIKGNSVYWSPVSQGLAAGRYLRAHLSDRAMPHLTTATSIGKIDWNTSGWAVERDAEDPKQLWIRTPYNLDYFEPFAPIMQLSERVRHNHEGTLDAQFYTEVGDEEVLAGPRGLSSSPEAFEYKLTRTAEVTAEMLPTLQTRLRRDQRDLGVSITARPCPALARQHRARVEVDCGADDAQLELALAYVRARPEITDVVLSRKDDVLSGFSRTLEIVERFRDIPHVLAIRLRSLRLLYAPEVFNRAAVTRLAARSRLQVVRPTRIEIETQLLHSSELRAEQGKVVRELQRRGVTVYANVPLLGYLNDNEQEMLAISGVCRDKGVEFTNLYVCGLPIQREHNAEFPIELNSVIDIATAVRRHGSGREVPRYILRTALGEVDFGFAPRIFDLDEEGGVGVRLLQQDLAFFKAIDPAFEWPEGVTVDEDGVARVPVAGLSLENQEFLFAPRGPAHPVGG